MPRVSVILCSYNHRDYVGAAVESVLAQTFDDYELIVLDNGSTDGTHDVLRAYEDRPKVRLHLNAANVAVSKRFNEGVGLARGDLISFLYSDDLFLPRKLELQVAEIDRHDDSYGVVDGGALRFHDAGGERWAMPALAETGDVLGALLRLPAIVNMLSPLTRRECFLRYPFYEDIFAEGEAWYFKPAMTYRFASVREPVVLLRDHPGNRGRAVRRTAEMTLETLKRLIAHPDFPSKYLDDARYAQRYVLRTSGWSTIRLDGDARWARDCFRNAVEIDWREAFNPRTAMGYALSHVPLRLRTPLNSLGDRLTRTKGNRNLVADFGGADARSGDA